MLRAIQGVAYSTFLMWDNGVPLGSGLPSDPANHCDLGAPDIPVCASPSFPNPPLCPLVAPAGSEVYWT